MKLLSNKLPTTPCILPPGEKGVRKKKEKSGMKDRKWWKLDCRTVHIPCLDFGMGILDQKHAKIFKTRKENLILSSRRVPLSET